MKAAEARRIAKEARSNPPDVVMSCIRDAAYHGEKEIYLLRKHMTEDEIAGLQKLGYQIDLVPVYTRSDDYYRISWCE